MKLIRQLVFTVILALILFGCSGGSPEAENNDDSVDNNDKQQTEETTKITDFQDSPGKDPLYPERYPDSVRAHHVERSFTSYIAEATIEEVIQYYKDQAELRSLEFFYEEVPEDLPHWITISSDVPEHVKTVSH